MNPASSVAVVTGAGSGVGRAVALMLAAHGWGVALVGRRAEALAAVLATASISEQSRLAAFPCDVSDAEAVAALAADVVARFARVDAVVAAAGTNIPRWSWEELSLADYRHVMAANLDGAYHCVRAFLPAMRRQGCGTFVLVNSEAGRRASAKSGVAYVASKFGLAGLAQSLNAEERVHGIRACSIFPGDIDTPLLEHRPAPPPASVRAKMLRSEDVAECVQLALTLPARAVLEEVILQPA